MLTQTYHSSSSSLNSNVSHKSSSKNHKKKLSFTPKLMKSLSAFTAKCEDSSDSDNEFEITQTTLSYRNASINGNNKQQLNNLLFQNGHIKHGSCSNLTQLYRLNYIPLNLNRMSHSIDTDKKRDGRIHLDKLRFLSQLKKYRKK